VDVWVVVLGQYSDQSVEGVFSSKKKAELFSRRFDGFVKKIELDALPDELRRGLRPFEVLMLQDGTTERISSVGHLFVPHGFVISKNGFRSAGSEDVLILSCLVWARDKKHAVKIANEKRAQLLVESRFLYGEEVWFPGYREDEPL
jgi:hypothetical protein